MADKVYAGGIPTHGFQSIATSGEGESAYTPGGADAKSPRIVRNGATPPKTYSKSASEGFLGDAGYKTTLEVGRPSSSKTVNPDDISHADHC